MPRLISEINLGLTAGILRVCNEIPEIKKPAPARPVLRALCVFVVDLFAATMLCLFIRNKIIWTA